MSAIKTATTNTPKARLSIDFLRVNRNYQAVIKVINGILAQAGFNMMTEYTLMTLADFQPYTHLFSKRHFRTSLGMQPAMDELSKADIKADFKETDKCRFQVHLNITLELAKKHFGDKLYQEAVRLSPSYQNEPLPPVEKSPAPVLSVVTDDPTPESPPTISIDEEGKPRVTIEREPNNIVDPVAQDEVTDADDGGDHNDEELIAQLTVKHPRIVLSYTPAALKGYLTNLVKDHGNGMILKWLVQTERDVGHGWPIREGSGFDRNGELFDFLTINGYDVVRGSDEGYKRRAPGFLYLRELAPTQMAQFQDDLPREEIKRDMEKQVIPPDILVPSNDLERFMTENWKPDMSAEELLQLLRMDIRALSKIANIAHFHEVTAGTLADVLIEAMDQLRAVPIVETTPIETSVTVGINIRVGLSVRPEMFKNMIKERVLFLMLRNSLFGFRGDPKP